MAFTTTPLGRTIGADLSNETDVDTTAKINMRGGPTTLRAMHITKAAAANAAHLKLVDSADSALTPGTNLPDHCIPLANDSVVVLVSTGGFYCANGLSMFAAEEDGNSAASDPDAAVAVTILTM